MAGGLRSAVGGEDLPALEALLATSSPVDADELGWALTDAADAGWVDGAAVLLEAGADPNWHPAGAPSGLPLAQAIHWLHLATVERLLDAGAEIEARDDKGRTPLHQAIYAEVDLATEDPPSARLTSLLVRRGADVFARTRKDETAADLARALGHSSAEQLLRQRMS